jgi:hypothetical protein
MFQIEDFEAPDSAQRLVRLQLRSTGQSSYDELWLQRLIASHPQVLPIAEIEPYLEGAVPVCIELGTAAGFVDVVLITPHGDLVLVECKLWRNPQARREVVGQIIDYAKELPRLSYEAFDIAIQKAEPTERAAKTNTLYQRSGAEAAGVDEASFVDAVTRNLRRGRFLLLIVGDGIREGVQNIFEFLQQHAGMHFTLALVEVAVYKLHVHGFVVQPRVLARTEMVPRGVVAIDDERVTIGPAKPAPAPSKAGILRAQNTVPATISEARLYEALDARLPGGAERLRQLIAALEGRGASPRFTSTTIVLQGAVLDRIVVLGRIDPATATIWFDDVAQHALARGREAGLAYYRALASLVRDPVLRETKLNPTTRTRTASLPLDDLLSAQQTWLVAVDEYLTALAEQDAAAR